MARPEIRFNGFENEWSIKSIGEVTSDVFAGGDTDFSRLKSAGNFPVYANALTDDGVVGYYDDYFRVTAPAVTVTGRGDVGFAKARFENFTPVVRLLVLISQLDPHFLEQSINRAPAMLESTGVPQLTVPQISQYRISVPSTYEQQLIGRQFASLEKISKFSKNRIIKLKSLKQSMLVKMFPQGGASVPEIRFEGFTDNWQRKSLEMMMNLGSGRDYKHLSEGDVPVYGTGGYMCSVNSALSTSEDAVGIGRKGSINSPYLLRAHKNVDLDFLYTVFQTINWTTYDESTGVPSLSKDTIYSVEVYAPSPEEQAAIGSYFRQLDQLIELEEAKLAKLTQLKTAFLSKMFV